MTGRLPPPPFDLESARPARLARTRLAIFLDSYMTI